MTQMVHVNQLGLPHKQNKHVLGAADFKGGKFSAKSCKNLTVFRIAFLRNFFFGFYVNLHK